jgi:hypothetical protein
MVTEDERKEDIKKAFFEYDFAKQILPEESFLLKANVIQDLIITTTVQSVTLSENVHLRHYIDTSKTLLYL